LLNLEPIVAARQLRESLSDKQKSDLQAIVTKHQAELQQVRTRLPVPAPGLTEGGIAEPGQQAGLNQGATEVSRIGDEVHAEINAILTPDQRTLLQRADPRRLAAQRPEAPADPAARAANVDAGC